MQISHKDSPPPPPPPPTLKKKIDTDLDESDLPCLQSAVSIADEAHVVAKIQAAEKLLQSENLLCMLIRCLKPKAEEIIKEEQVGFRTERSTTEQIFNLRIICEKYLQHQQSLYHVFMGFKKAFERVWHAASWATMMLYNINDNLTRTTECLYNKATSAVFHDNNIREVREWFRTTIGVRRGCLLSPTLFNIILERILADAPEDHAGTVSIGGRTIKNLRIADDIDGLAGQEQELVKLVNHLEEASTA